MATTLFLGHFIVTFFDMEMSYLSSNLLKRYLQHDNMPFFPLESRFTTFCLGMRTNHFFFSAVVDLLLGLLPVEWVFLCLSSVSSSL